MNDQFGSWEDYVAAIQAQNGVRVLGVTDHLTIPGYSRLRAEKLAGHLPNVDLLIPNIEFRLAPPGDKATSVNIHLLVSPDDPEHEKQINQALARLRTIDRRTLASSSRCAEFLKAARQPSDDASAATI